MRPPAAAPPGAPMPAPFSLVDNGVEQPELTAITRIEDKTISPFLLFITSPLLIYLNSQIPTHFLSRACGSNLRNARRKAHTVCSCRQADRELRNLRVYSQIERNNYAADIRHVETGAQFRTQRLEPGCASLYAH